MASGTSTAVTPRGVRDGDPVALSGLTARRGPAVLAYARAIAPGAEVDAATEAFSEFRSAVAATDDPVGIDPERLLLHTTRHAAARHTPRSTGSGAAGLLARGKAAKTCEMIPDLLVARAEGILTEADRDRLERHLQRCVACRGARDRFLDAERSYREAPEGPIDQTASQAIMRALFDAAPIAALVAEAGEQLEPHPEPGPDPKLATDPEPDRAPALRPVVVIDEVAPRATTYAGEVVDQPGPLANGNGRHASGDTRLAAAVLPDEPNHPVLRFVIPASVLLVALAVALAVAGAFSGSKPARSEADAPVAPTAAVTTPLPAEPPAAADQTAAQRRAARERREARQKRLAAKRAEEAAAAAVQAEDTTGVVTPTPAARTPRPPASAPSRPPSTARPSTGTQLEADSPRKPTVRPPATSTPPATEDPGFQPTP